jgi:cobalt/nickel transport system ATP-binding protein
MELDTEHETPDTMARAATPLIRIEGLCFRYPGGPPILQGLDFALDRGERAGIIAPNGSGKTTLFHLVMGLLKPTAGTLAIFGREVHTEKDFAEVRRRVGLLFQDADDQLFSPTVLEDVAFGPLNLGKTKDEAVAIARRTLDFLGLNGFEDRITFKLSGGEKRLVSLASVLAMEPEVLLLDEPVNGLDTRTRAKLVEVLRLLELSYVLISHELDFLTATTDTVYTMEAGKIFFDRELHIHQHVHAHPLGARPHEHRPPDVPK